MYRIKRCSAQAPSVVAISRKRLLMGLVVGAAASRDKNIICQIRFLIFLILNSNPIEELMGW